MKYWILIMLLFVTVSNGNSTVIANFGENRINYEVKTHFLVVGYAGEVDDLFLETAQSRLLKIHELYPLEQKVVILAKGKKSQQLRFKKKLQRQGHNIIHEDNTKLSSQKLFSMMSGFKRIGSINFVTHSSAELGIGLDKRGNRLSHTSDFFKKIRPNLTSDAHIFLHGCNTGFIAAPEISKVLGIPVYGSLTGTDFQRLHKDGNWYFNNSTDYPSPDWAKANNISFREPKNCVKSGGCTRMKPINSSYHGYWGDYSAGLPFYKLFCASNVSNERCLHSYALGALLWPSVANLGIEPKEEDFKNVVLDMLCPLGKTPEIYIKCIKEVRAAELDESLSSFPFNGEEFSCDKEKCYWGSRTIRLHGYKVPLFYSIKKSKRGQIVIEYLENVKAFEML